MIDLNSISISPQSVRHSPGTLADALAGMAGVKELPPPSLAEQIQKIRENSKFTENKPTILFISDYIVDDQFIGILIVFEKYLNATHYEIFKKNKFDNEPKFERVLFLDSVALEQETKNFLPFLISAGFSLDADSVLIVLDNNIKQDRIYEFFVRSGRVPQAINELNLELIMKSKNMLNSAMSSEGSTIKSISSSLFGAPESSWIIALLNDFVPFFGNPLGFSQGQEIIFPKDTSQLMKIINDAVYLFGAKISLVHLLSILGSIHTFDVSKKKPGRINEEIFQSFSESIDELNGTFSFDFLNSFLLENSETFKALSESTTLNKKTGTLPFGSLENLSQIFSYIQSLDFSVMNFQQTIVDPLPVAATQETQDLMAITTGTDGGLSSEAADRELKAIT